MSTVEHAKARVVEAVESLADELERLSLQIHANPELCFKEEKAHGWLTEFLAKRGLRVERGVGGLPTAFRATVPGSGPGPRVAIMAEYDALPGIGHACGHNVIATAGAGAGAALAVALDAMRQHLRPDARVHGIISKGGEQPNIIPEHTSAHFYLRALDRDYCGELLRRFQAAAEGAATATGCRVAVVTEPTVHEPLKPNATMARLFAANLERIGFPEDPEDPEAGYGSTDCGNVSQALPTIHPYVRISPDGVPSHSREFAEWARSSMARVGMVAGAKALALTALDLLASPPALQQAKADFTKGG